jgi:hypothetical protein
MNPSCCKFSNMLQKYRWNGSFQLQNAAHSTKKLQIPWKTTASNSKMPYRWNGSFQLQNAANSKENGQNRKSKQKKQTDKTNDSGPIGFSVATSAGHSVSNWRNLKTKNATMPRNETLRFRICCWPAPYTRDPVEWARSNPTIERKSQERLGKNNNQLKILGRGCDH